MPISWLASYNPSPFRELAAVPTPADHRHAGKVRPPDAGQAGGADRGYARQPRLLPDSFHARAAHPPREATFQHLHQPGSHCPEWPQSFMTVYGKVGLRELALQNTAKRALIWRENSSPHSPGNSSMNSWPGSGTGSGYNDVLMEKKIIGGLPLGPLLYPELHDSGCWIWPPPLTPMNGVRGRQSDELQRCVAARPGRSTERLLRL